ncbi:hypothetical protein LJ737_04160 [Hymenobacter sp. 15J16-1T3B]|uniref:hypothetical protein n=1 Tax=Hymenobacter sp. 15J16-1T3B TaxID=2886941 RepID=UPI001D11910B|nr:hypothetical protein [Hymenobacter sp. 15J16-1T3B]MCC3156416.1 hypothetical protein [Hymenobacter sp. 15J16-1T3B]
MSWLQAYLPVLVLLGGVFWLAGTAAGSNAYQVLKNYDISHLWETRERLAAIGPQAVLAYLPDLLAGQHWLALASVVLSLPAAAALFSLRFDRRMNSRRHLNPLYVGTDPGTAASDSQVQRWGLTGLQYALVKAAIMLLCLGVLLWLRCP